MNFGLAQLRHLIALAEHRTFTDAAAAVHRSQAAFSRSIASLEAGVGAPLVDRIGHRNELTALGRTVLEHARHVVAQADALEDAVRVETRTGVGNLRIGLGSTPSGLLTRPMLAFAAAQGRAMRLRISVATGDALLQSLRERRLDALVLELQSVIAAPDLAIEPLARLPVGVLCRPGHPLAGAARPAFADLLDYPVACTDVSDDVARRMVERFGPRAHPSEFVNLCSEDPASLLAVAKTTDAIYVGTLAIAREAIANGELVALRIGTTGFEARFGMVRIAGATAPHGLAAVRRTIARVMRA